VAVIGAGAFGGWTALYLRRSGARVTLLDAWGPGNSRASSGGETRIIRATYGADRVYVGFVARALQLWRENDRRWNTRLYHSTGFIRMPGKDDSYERNALPLLREAGLRVEEWTPAEAGKHYPQFNFEGLSWVLHEADAGYLTARESCQAVLKAFIQEGGQYRQLAVKPGAIESGEMHNIALSDGSRLGADRFIFACGPWLGTVFPDVIGDRITPTRQEVYFFGLPAGNSSFFEPQFPAWIEAGPPHYYGTPVYEWRGFKIGDDERRAALNPTSEDRFLTPETFNELRKYVHFRFPALRGAPLLESRVCQYERSPDRHFIIDRHPAAQNVWMLGGGSGHGFKHGPALGEWVADVVLGKKPMNPFFALSRFNTK
jgi:glycine/D-amino acid oxidase-like deaminating enzyme